MDLYKLAPLTEVIVCAVKARIQTGTLQLLEVVEVAMSASSLASLTCTGRTKSWHLPHLDLSTST
jgi:hypothetical protein